MKKTGKITASDFHEFKLFLHKSFENMNCSKQEIADFLGVTSKHLGRICSSNNERLPSRKLWSKICFLLKFKDKENKLLDVARAARHLL